MELRVGQILYLVPSGNMARRFKDKIFEVKVKSIGRKYGMVVSNSHELFLDYNVSDKFDLETLANHNGNYSPEYYLFTDYNDIYNKPNLREKLKSMLYGLSYEELLSIEKDINFLKSKL